MRRRALLLALLLTALALFTGCGEETGGIEARAWELMRVQSAEDGAVLACRAEEQALWPDAAALPEGIALTALDGALRLTSGEREYTGVYAPLEGDDAQTRLYAVEWLDGGSAQAICGFAEEGGEETPVLLLRGQEEVLTFAPKA